MQSCFGATLVHQQLYNQCDFQALKPTAGTCRCGLPSSPLAQLETEMCLRLLASYMAAEAPQQGNKANSGTATSQVVCV